MKVFLVFATLWMLFLSFLLIGPCFSPELKEYFRSTSENHTTIKSTSDTTNTILKGQWYYYQYMGK